jgi:hypothetical protein
LAAKSAAEVADVISFHECYVSRYTLCLSFFFLKTTAGPNHHHHIITYCLWIGKAGLTNVTEEGDACIILNRIY